MVELADRTPGGLFYPPLSETVGARHSKAREILKTKMISQISARNLMGCWKIQSNIIDRWCAVGYDSAQALSALIIAVI